MSFYQRNLPHWQPDCAEYFVTFRLAGSLPAEAIKRIQAIRNEFKESDEDITNIQHRVFATYEQILNTSSTGPVWLKNKSVAKIVCNALHYRDQSKYDLYAYCVMPNHVHLVFKLLDINKIEMQSDFPVTKILRELKRYTAYKCNKILGREGQFWQHESFDRVIRNTEELGNTLKYVLYNPVKAGLVNDLKEWPYIYCKPEFLKM